MTDTKVTVSREALELVLTKTQYHVRQLAQAGTGLELQAAWSALRLTVDTDTEELAGLRERWTDFLEREADVRKLAERANEDGSYTEYDEACDDHRELGSELAADLAAFIGFPAAISEQTTGQG